MKRMFGIVCLSVLVLPAQLSAREPGHYREDGTYVYPHKKATPNRSYQKDVSPDRSSNPYRGKTRVPGYYRENGTYVYPQEQPAPDRSYYNNLGRDRIIDHDSRTRRHARSPQRRFDRKRNFARRYGAVGGSTGFPRY